MNPAPTTTPTPATTKSVKRRISTSFKSQNPYILKSSNPCILKFVEFGCTVIHQRPRTSDNTGHADHPRRPAALCRRPQPVRAHDAEARTRQVGLRAGRPDPRAGARAGPDAAPPRQGLSCRRPRARYATLGIEEDFFVNYGFVTRSVQALMHPRSMPTSLRSPPPWPAARRAAAAAARVRARARRGAPARGG